jgi:transposase
MTSRYPEDFRRRVVAAVGKGLSRRGAADLFQIGASTAINWVRSWEETGSVASQPMGGDRSSKIVGEDADWVLDLVRAKPDLTLVEIQSELHRQRGIGVSIAAVWRFLDKHGLRFKKSLHAAEQERPDVRPLACSGASQPLLNPEQLIFIHETWVTTNMARRCGWALRGERLVAGVPYGHWKTTTFVAGLRCDGIVAPCVIDGPMNGDAFLAYIEQVLAPTLRPGPPRHHGQSLKPQSRRRRAHEALCRSTFRPTARISIPSRTPLPSSRLLLRAAAERTSATSGIASDQSCISSHQMNAETTSEMPDMPNLARKML